MTAKIILLAPAANMSFGGAPSGASYLSDPNGLIVITNGSAADQASLIAAGCTTLYPLNTLTLPMFTVATLPSPSPGGQTAFVSDCTVQMIGTSIGLEVASLGGGTNIVRLFSDGTYWRIG